MLNKKIRGTKGKRYFKLCTINMSAMSYINLAQSHSFAISENLLRILLHSGGARDIIRGCRWIPEYVLRKTDRQK